MTYFRKNINAMGGYTPGKQPKGGGYIKLNTNENPFPPSPKVLEAIKEAADDELRKYPDPMGTAAREKAADVFGVEPGMVLCGNGSDELLTMIVRAFAGEGDLIITPYPTYSLYETLAEIQGARFESIDFEEDYSLPADFARPDAKITFVPNPNSPSGTVVPKDVLRDLAGKLDGILVIDEAYVEFADSDCLGLVNELPNVIVLRTFSKSFSLAGMRIGFGFAQKEIIDGLIKVKDSYNVNRLFIAAAVAGLDDMEHVRGNAQKIRENRAHLTQQLRGLGAYVWPSQSNFVLARFSPPVSARRLFEELEARKILVRYFKYRRLEDCLRITVGTRQEIDALMGAMAELVESKAVVV
ncbi:MAG: histidinol-phosphate transaminase [Planctomycetes bacterium]|nr:histidinol-phosphate transaminase [Planctomycetota bacterium]